MPILIFSSKSGLGDDFGQYNTKLIILLRFLGKRLLEIAFPWPKVPSDQKLFERVCCMFKLKVTKFQRPTPKGFSELYKKQLGGASLPPVQNRVNRNNVFWPTYRHKSMLVNLSDKSVT